MNVSLIEDSITQSQAGTTSFGQIIVKLIAAGFEAYHVDLVRHENRYYLPNGQSHVAAVSLSPDPIAKEFSAEAIAAAVRGAQSGQLKYPDFVRQVKTAGCNYYVVYLSGRKVAYFGRHGESHTEHFPPVKS
jgi:uncharacterized protein YbcV (DUF1398 family)